MIGIYPLNKSKVSTDWKNYKSDAYKKEFGMVHYGTDYAAPIGTDCYAVNDAAVIFAGTDPTYGKCVNLFFNADGIDYVVSYNHLNDILVKVGDKVTLGHVIGKVGKTGKYVTGPHLHIEVQKNVQKWMDPFKNDKTINPCAVLGDSYKKPNNSTAQLQAENTQLKAEINALKNKIENAKKQLG